MVTETTKKGKKALSLLFYFLPIELMLCYKDLAKRSDYPTIGPALMAHHTGYWSSGLHSIKKLLKYLKVPERGT